jgi:hypothetical protein
VLFGLLFPLALAARKTRRTLASAPGDGAGPGLAEPHFFLRLSRPAPMEPRPSKPSKGSGEAVCGKLAPALSFVDVALFCALTSLEVELLGVLVLLLCALMSELVELLGGVVVAELLGAAV